MVKIGVIHATCAAVEPLNEAAKRMGDDITLLNFVNENLLLRANLVGGADKYGLRSFARVFFEAADAGVDGIIVACTVYTPFVELVRKFVDVPVIGIDNPMLVSAVNQGTKIGIVATTAASGPSAQKQMEEIAAVLGKTVDFEIEIVTEAMKALKSENVELHNRYVYDAGKRLKDAGCDVIVIAQISTACAAEGMADLNVPVLTSPAEGIKKILEMISEESAASEA